MSLNRKEKGRNESKMACIVKLNEIKVKAMSTHLKFDHPITILLVTSVGHF